MKLKTSIVLIFLSLTLLIGSVVFLTLKNSEKALEDQIGIGSVAITKKVLTEIDKIIFIRVEQLIAFAKDQHFEEKAIISNNHFAKLSDIDQYIESIDEDWINKKNTDQISEVLNNEISQQLKRKIQNLEKRFGYFVFGELAVLNRYGALVGVYPRMTDFYQTDESWYEQAMNEKDFWVGDLEYDDSSETYSMPIAIKLFNSEGEYIGLMFGALNLEDIKPSLEVFKAQSLYKTIHPYLINKNGYIIFSGLEPDFKKVRKDWKLEEFGTNLSTRISFKNAMNGESGFLISENAQPKLLSAYSDSKGYKNFKGLGWSLVVDYEIDEIFRPITELKQQFIQALFVAIFLAVIAGIYVYRSIAKPIIHLKSAAQKIGKGDWDAAASVHGQSEIGELAISINRMAHDLKTTTLSKNEVDHIFKALDESMIVVNPDLKIRNANPSACRLLGFKGGKLTGNRIEQIFPEDIVAEIKSAYANQKTQGEFGPFEAQLGLKNNSSTFVRLTGSPLRDDNGNFQGMVLLIQDINEQKLAEERKNLIEKQTIELLSKLRSIVEGTSETVGKEFYSSLAQHMGNMLGHRYALIGEIIDSHLGRRVKTLALFGDGKILENVEYGLSGTPCDDVLTGDICVHSENIQALFPEDLMLVEIEAESYIGVPVIDSDSQKPIGLLAVSDDKPLQNSARDVSILKIFAARIEAEMKRHRAENRLIKSSEKLKISNKNLEEFAYIASHDMQEPLRKIVSFGERLKDEMDNEDEQCVQYLNKMQNAAERMQQLILDILELSKLNTKRVPLRSCDLEDVGKDVVEDLESLIAKTEGNVSIGALPKIDGDRTQIYTLFQNLIGNGLKYHREGVPPKINVSSDFNEGNTSWNIYFTDNGIGFDEKYFERILKPFERLHGKGVYAGTGIGLAICNKIVQLHSGSISAKSCPGKGTTFVLTLPENQDHYSE